MGQENVSLSICVELEDRQPKVKVRLIGILRVGGGSQKIHARFAETTAINGDEGTAHMPPFKGDALYNKFMCFFFPLAKPQTPATNVRRTW